MKFGLVLILGILGVTTAFAESWQCRNDLEVSCADGICEAKTQGDFTPMSVTFDDNGKMSVCAYTGCWEGIGRGFKTNGFLVLTGQNFKFSTSDSPEMNQDVAIIFDRKDKVAMVKAGGFAQPLICKKGEQSADLPTFDKYKVEVSKDKPKPVKLAGNANARMFRTRLREANKGGVNFAGHYIFASWGCGTSCLMGAIIDTKTGDVYFPEELGGMSFGFLGEDDVPLQYQKDSKLFILTGSSGEDGLNGTQHLVWEGTKFKRVKFIKSDRQY